MADAYALNLTTGALSKNGTALANINDVVVGLVLEHEPGVLEGAPGSFVSGFTIVARIHDPAADARILAQGPPGLLPSIAGIAGKPTQYKLTSKTGDTLALSGVPATITAAPLATPSVDGFQP
jgi:hypothetical protein